MKPTLLSEYYELKESGSTSDFPNLLGNLMHRSLIDWAHSIPEIWRKYAAIGEVNDFRPLTRIVGYEAEDLLAVDETGAYQDSGLADAAYVVQIGTYGRAFSVTRKVIINDDLGYIKQQPRRFGRSAARAIAKFVAQTLLEANGLTYDGNALFDGTNHFNSDTGAGSALSALNLEKAIALMSEQTVNGVFQQVQAKYLLVRPQDQWLAKQIINSAIIVAAGTAGTVTQLGSANVLENALEIIVEPFLTVPGQFYVLADPNDVPILDLVFLNGKQTPDLLIERPVMMNLAGGDDPYEFEYDIMKYKVRYEYGGAMSLWWGAYRFVGS